jgi:hypothetical protein
MLSKPLMMQHDARREHCSAIEASSSLRRGNSGTGKKASNLAIIASIPLQIESPTLSIDLMLARSLAVALF